MYVVLRLNRHSIIVSIVFARPTPLIQSALFVVKFLPTIEIKREWGMSSIWIYQRGLSHLFFFPSLFTPDHRFFLSNRQLFLPKKGIEQWATQRTLLCSNAKIKSIRYRILFSARSTFLLLSTLLRRTRLIVAYLTAGQKVVNSPPKYRALYYSTKSPFSHQSSIPFLRNQTSSSFLTQALSTRWMVSSLTPTLNLMR